MAGELSRYYIGVSFRGRDGQGEGVYCRTRQVGKSVPKGCRRAGEMAERYGLNREVIDVNETLIDYLQHNTLGAAGILVPPYTLAFYRQA